MNGSSSVADSAAGGLGAAGGIVAWGQVFLSLILVLGAIFLVLWALRRMQGMTGRAGRGVEVLGGVSVGTKERVVVTRVGERYLVLGVAPGSVRTLCELDGPPGDAGGGRAPATVGDLVARWRGQERSTS